MKHIQSTLNRNRLGQIASCLEHFAEKVREQTSWKENLMPVFEKEGILELALVLEKESFKAIEANKTNFYWSKAQDSD